MDRYANNVLNKHFIFLLIWCLPKCFFYFFLKEMINFAFLPLKIYVLEHEREGQREREREFQADSMCVEPNTGL